MATGAVAETTGPGDPLSAENWKADFPLLDQSLPQREAPLSFRRAEVRANTFLGE
jgi:hypothetical protein